MKMGYHKIPDGKMMKDSDMKSYKGKPVGKSGKLDEALTGKPGMMGRDNFKKMWGK